MRKDLTSKLVKFEGEGNCKEEELISNSNEKSNSEVVAVQYVDLHCCDVVELWLIYFVEEFQMKGSTV